MKLDFFSLLFEQGLHECEKLMRPIYDAAKLQCNILWLEGIYSEVHDFSSFSLFILLQI